MYEFAHIVLAFLFVVSILFAIPAFFIGFKESGYGSMSVFLFAIALLIFHFGLAPKKSFTDLELVQSGVAYFDLNPTNGTTQILLRTIPNNEVDNIK